MSFMKDNIAVDDETGEVLTQAPGVRTKVYNDGRTQQAFLEQTDLNRVLRKGSIQQALSHLERFEGEYGDFTGLDIEGALNQITRARGVFEQLPASLKEEFHHDPTKFFDFVNKPENQGRLAEIFPELAEPGIQMPNVDRRGQTPPAADPPAPAAAGKQKADSGEKGSEAKEEGAKE